MPERALQQCRQPSCREVATRNGYCAAHTARTAVPSFTTADRGVSYTAARYRAARHSFMVRHPVCSRCHEKLATILDHIVPHRGIYRLFWDHDNWQALCVSCHARKTYAETLAPERSDR